MNTIVRTTEIKLDSTPRRNKNAKPVLVYKGEFGVYASVKDTAKKLNLFPGDVSKVCNGKARVTKGYRMCFVKDMPEHILDIINAINGVDDELERKKAEEERKREEAERKKAEAAERKRKEARQKKANAMQAKMDKIIAKLEQMQAEYDAFMGDE